VLLFLQNKGGLLTTLWQLCFKADAVPVKKASKGNLSAVEAVYV